MPTLLPKPILADLQTYVSALEKERGFADQTVIEKCLLLGEEVGELFKAIRKAEGVATETGVVTGEVGEELADVLIMLLSVANHTDIDLELALRAKEEKNKTRSWS